MLQQFIELKIQWNFRQVFSYSTEYSSNIAATLQVYCRYVAKLLQYCQNILCSMGQN